MLLFVLLSFSYIVHAANENCPVGYEMLSTGVQCYTDSFCAELASGYSCENQVCCRPRNAHTCPSNQVQVNGACYFTVGLNEPCSFTEQCRANGQCSQGFCRTEADLGDAPCNDPTNVVERLPGNNRVPDCLYEPCSPGFSCEYSWAASRYQCCGLYHRQVDMKYGIALIYPGSNKPIVCFPSYGGLACPFANTPNCVYSNRYKCNVCCSTNNC